MAGGRARRERIAWGDEQRRSWPLASRTSSWLAAGPAGAAVAGAGRLSRGADALRAPRQTPLPLFPSKPRPRPRPRPRPFPHPARAEKPPSLKRQPKAPREGFTLTDVKLETMTAIPYDILKEGIA
jgi:hypothetical protein